MKSLVIIFFSTLLFHSSDAGSFTWLHSDDTVNFVEGETAKLNWSVRIGAGKTWLSVKITRKNENVGAGGVDMIRRKPSGVDILLANRTADMDLDVQTNSNVLSVSFSLGNLSRRADEMYYRITVVDDDTDSSWKHTKLNVYVPSSCKIHPNATTVNETENVSLNVITTGNPPVNDYNWTHPNGSSPPGITDRWTFTATRQDNGTYKVSVSNGVGDRSYCTSNVTVQFPPTAVTPSLVRVKNLKNISLQCSAQGKPEPTYSWTSTTNKTLQIRDNGKTMVLINATLEDSGRYTCTAKNSLGVSSSTSNVVVEYPVGCTIYPDLQPIVVNESDSVNLTCNTKGNPPVNQFSWTYPNGTTLPGTSVLQYRASRMDISIYNCFIQNIFNDSGNCTRKVSVQFKPVLVNISLVKDPQTRVREENGMIIANETDSFNLTCKSHAYPVATYKWTVPDQSLFTELDKQTLVLNNVTRNHTGTYVCTANNVVGETSTSKDLNVNFKPGQVDISLVKYPQTTVREENGNIFANETDSFNLTCESHAYPVATYKWTVPDQSLFTELNQQTLVLNKVTKNHTGTYVCTASNLIGEAKSNPKNLSVNYIDKPTFPCFKSAAIGPENANFTLNLSVYSFPEVNKFQCYSISKNTLVIIFRAAFDKFSVTITANDYPNCTCWFENKAGRQLVYFPVYKNSWGWVKGHFTIADKSMSDLPQLNQTLTTMFYNLYRCISYVDHVIIDRFSKGSVIVDFRLYAIGGLDDAKYLAPLKDAVNQDSGITNGLKIVAIKQGTYKPPPSTTTTTKPTTNQDNDDEKPDHTMTIIIVIVVVVVLIVLFVLIWCCCKKKRADRKNSALVDNNVAVVIPMNEEPGKRNDGFSPSEYAQHGPSHIDPAYDSVDRVRKDEKDKNDNPTQSEKETEEPAYAAVDKSKKTKKRNPGELLYADLGDFQKNGDKAGGRGGIVLEPLPKGQKAKMPDKYEETIYAEIVRTQKPASDDQNAEGASTGVPLGDLHGQGAETDKPSAETADPSKPNDQKPATGETEKPPDDQQAKPLAKEDSENTSSQTQPADSLHTMNRRNDTTLTTVSL